MQYFEYRNEQFPFLITRKKVKNINARLKADGIIYVSAPRGVSVDAIRSMLLANAERFRMARLHAAEQAANLPDYTDGSEIRYLGTAVTLRYDENVAVPILENRTLRLPAANPESAEQLVRHWIKERALLLYSRINKEVCKDYRSHG